MHDLVADENYLSLAVAVVGSVAALVSVVIAGCVQREGTRLRHRQELESAIQQAVLVQWAARDSAHYWGEPLANFKVAYERVRRYNLVSAQLLADHGPPSESEDKWLEEALDIECLAEGALIDLRRELAKHP